MEGQFQGSEFAIKLVHESHESWKKLVSGKANPAGIEM